MKLGICCDPDYLKHSPAEQPLSTLPRLVEILQEAGAGYLECSVGAVMPAGGEAEFDKLRVALLAYELRAEVFNCFLPAHHRITGREVHLSDVLSYCSAALTRCKALGGEVVVLGSGGARKVPEGFDRATAELQFIQFCRELAPIADDIDIDIAIEPLNAREDNLILSVAHGAAIMDEVAHPRIRLLADLYHITEEGEYLDNVAMAGSRLRHTHVADLGRVAPGFADHGEAEFTKFFASLRRAGYAELADARCSFEGRIDDIECQAVPMLDLLRERWLQSGVPAEAVLA